MDMTPQAWPDWYLSLIHISACKTATGKAELKAAYEAERGRFQH